MWSSPEAMISKNKTGPVEAVTENLTAEWTIENVSRLPEGKGDSVHLSFFPSSDGEGKWILSLFPQGARGDDDEDYVLIHLCQISVKTALEEIKLPVKLSIPQWGNTPTLMCTYEGKIKYEHSEKIRRSELLEVCSYDDTLKIICKIDIPWETVESMEEAFEFQESQLTQDFRLLYNNLKLSDFTVIVESQKFPTHKVVLAARSPVFSAMFENKETRENKTNQVEIEDMLPDVVDSMLEFFYTDQVSNLEELAFELWEAANKYEIPRLRKMCEKVLYKLLNKDNAAGIWVHADLYCSYKLKEHVMGFMNHHRSDVGNMESYKLMQEEYPDLVMEFNNFIIDKPETTVLLAKTDGA